MKELTLKQYDKLKSYVEKAGFGLPADVRIFFDPKCKFGAYDYLQDRIRLMDAPNMLFELTPCVVHELIHRRQRQRMPLIKWALLNLFRRLEPEAIAAEELAEARLGISLK
ncbi:MAG TPA: hypothetical protein PLA71_00670 [Saccharofermentans sp.]|nr:hypothetical protein [Saccharofermentans sp.]